MAWLKIKTFFKERKTRESKQIGSQNSNNNKMKHNQSQSKMGAV